MTLGQLFNPRSVVLVGASEELDRAGGRLVTYMTSNGFRGRVYHVNPSRSTIFGEPCYSSVSELPETPDLALVALNARLAADVVWDIGGAGIPVAVLFASGFAEIGGQGTQLQEKLSEAIARTGIRVLGPNTAGVRATHVGLFGEQGTNLGTVGFLPGSVAMVSQSGALGGYFGSTYLNRIGVGTRYFVDTGNEVDIDAAECLGYIAEDPAVSCICLILETCRDGRRLTASVRDATAKGKPVLLLKVGRSQEGMKAAASHTAAMSSQVELFEAELAAAGAFVTRDETQLTDAMLLHASGAVPASRRVGVVTPSGGFGVLALDLAGELGLSLPAVEQATEATVGGEIGLGGLSNPLEVAGLAGSGTRLLEASLEHMSRQPEIDSVVLWHPHRLLDEREKRGNAEALVDSHKRSGKPHFHCGMAAPDMAALLLDSGIPSFQSPRKLFSAIAAVAPPEPGLTPGSAPVTRGGAAPDTSAAQARHLMSELGISVAPTVVCTTAPDAVAAAQLWNAPVFLKLESRMATHKTEERLVRGPLAGNAISEQFEELANSGARERDPMAEIVVQPLVSGVELALGAYHDTLFGPSVMVAHGGIFVEVFRDAAFAAAPVDFGRAVAMIQSLRAYPALSGARGDPADVAAVARAVVALSEYIGSSPGGPGISIDVNPLIVRSAGLGAVAVDVRMTADR